MQKLQLWKCAADYMYLLRPDHGAVWSWCVRGRCRHVNRLFYSALAAFVLVPCFSYSLVGCPRRIALGSPPMLHHLFLFQGLGRLSTFATRLTRRTCFLPYHFHPTSLAC